MLKLTIEQYEISYAGIYKSPAFALWGEGGRLIEGLYKAFADYGISLSDISIDYSSPDSSSHGVKVDLGGLGDYKFNFEQVQWAASDPSNDDFLRVPEVLQHGESWLRSVVPDLAFKFHVLNCYTHNSLSEGTSQDFLRSFSEADVPGVGTSLGSGIVFHWDLPEHSWRMNLTIDHSNVIEGGIFIDQEVIAQSDQIDYAKFVISSGEILKNILFKIGLEYEGEK